MNVHTFEWSHTLLTPFSFTLFLFYFDFLNVTHTKLTLRHLIPIYIYTLLHIHTQYVTYYYYYYYCYYSITRNNTKWQTWNNYRSTLSLGLIYDNFSIKQSWPNIIIIIGCDMGVRVMVWHGCDVGVTWVWSINQ